MAPTIPQLQQIFSGVVSLSASNRIQALTAAVGWYESAIPFFRPSFGPDEESKLQKAMKARSLGFGGQSDGEQETALRTAVRLFERCLERAGVPKLEAAYKELEARRSSLEQAAAQAEVEYAAPMAALRSAFGFLGLSFKVDPNATTARQFDARGGIIYSPAHLQAVTAKVPGYQGVLPLVLSEMEVALKASAVQRDAMGNARIDAVTLVGKLRPTIEGILNWLAGSPQGAADPAIVPQGTQPATPQIPSQKSAKATKKAPQPKTAGNPYRGMKGQIYDALLAHAGTRVNMSTIVLGLGAKDPRRMLGHIADDGERLGKWTLKIERNGWLRFDLI